jgi:hypothetical protein
MSIMKNNSAGQSAAKLLSRDESYPIAANFSSAGPLE